jgi:glycosyltransferase involved in cell wall biosynthesis
LPVLAYNISGCNDIIDDQINGILVENVSQFKNEVVNFVDGKYQFCDIREYISKKFNQALIYEQLLDLISSVAKKSVKNII